MRKDKVLESIIYTTRKPEKSNGITDGNISSVIYTDGHNSVSKSVGFTDGIYISSGNTQRHGDVRRFYRRKVPRDSNCDSRTVTWRFHRRHHRRNHRRKHRRKYSVDDSVEKKHYMHPSADTLFLCFSFFFFFPIPPLPSQTAAPLPNCSQTPIPNSPLYILNTSTQVSYILYVVTISISCRFYHFFVSKSILFSFNI